MIQTSTTEGAMYVGSPKRWLSIPIRSRSEPEVAATHRPSSLRSARLMLATSSRSSTVKVEFADCARSCRGRKAKAIAEANTNVKVFWLSGWRIVNLRIDAAVQVNSTEAELIYNRR